MAKQKGHRANKPNDSFGTVNNENLYRGDYRKEVYEDEDEKEHTELAEDPTEKAEATPAEDSSFAQPQQEPETDYKKRYDDLKRHYDSKLEEWKLKESELTKTQEIAVESGVSATELPKNVQELEEFKNKYPDVYAIVETVSSIQAENKITALKSEVEELKGKEEQLKIQAAFKELQAYHPDFITLRTDEKFLAWLDQQPDSISDGIFKNNTDAKWAARVVDFYKADTGVQKTKTSNKSKDPATAVTKKVSTNIVADNDSSKRIWKASEIGKLKPWEFDKLEAELDAARAEGRVDLNS